MQDAYGRLKIKLGKKAPFVTLSQIRVLIKVLPSMKRQLKGFLLRKNGQGIMVHQVLWGWHIA